MGWLHAVPKPREGSKRAKKAELDDRNRLQRLNDDKITVQMPPNPAPHVITRLVEIGLTQAAGMGEGPISWHEINEWQRATGVNLSGFEAKLMRELSVAYVGEKAKATSENAPPPWAPRFE